MRHERFPSSEGETTGSERRAERVTFEVLADVKLGFAPWRRVRLLDVSVTGFRIAGVPQGSQAAEVRIRLSGLEIMAARVRRRDTSGIGCEFVQPLSIYVLEHMAARAG